jgi:4-aminobutyrate aminotransferase-like enzyme/Ser/Thr protein kinase RdoA (MazF antagonist)
MTVESTGADALDVARRPRLSADEAAQILARLYGLEGGLAPLPSERDQNFRVSTEDGGVAVLKISHPAEDRGFLELQHLILARLAEATPRYRFPGPVVSREGRAIETMDRDGAPILVRVLSWVPGVPLARARPHTAELRERLGSMLATVDRTLEGLDHPAAHRSLRWDLRQANAVITANLPHLADAAQRQWVARLAHEAAAGVAARAAALRTGVIHNDGNDHNVLVTAVHGSPAAAETRAVEGLIDFGDVIHTWLVAEPAIAAAYAMMGQPDPLASAGDLVAGYHRVHPLTEDELAALPHLIVQRLLTSVALSAAQAAADPDNHYLSVSEAPAWELLHRLADEGPELVHYTLRHRCGLEPCPGSRALVTWLRDNAGRAAPVLDPDPSDVPSCVLDLSVGSPGLGSDVEELDAAGFTELIFGRMAAAGARVGIGLYDEARRWYDGPAYVRPGDAAEGRTVHLGIDLFASPGTSVHAPLGGVVYSVQDNDARLDYGPTLILEHERGDGGRFHTLYGHLDPAVLDALSVGDQVVAGQAVAAVGDHPRNGDWPPHLHFQLIADTMGRRGEFPGVAAPAHREVWLSLSPDPNLLLGIAGLAPASRGLDKRELMEARRAHLGPTLSISYRRPLKIVRGTGQFLVDDMGRRYLDCVNNVAHVGHCHPRVVAAGARQMAVLNTNTRYLHDALVEYAERLTSTLPEPLSVCFLVCSGSEANELALRMARTHARAHDVLVVEGAYHGNTSSMVELSPYKFDGPGGSGAAEHVHKVAMPDRYRGRFRAADGDTGDRYAKDVAQVVADLVERGRRPAAFFCESLLSCGGQIVLPEGYLSEAVKAVRGAGGVYVADEVQVGFGRVGSHFWGFETQGVTPDIVTMGKPIGNGHPIGAVVTTQEVAASFDTGMEYFNTFGGNPVSCAVGLAVLDVIEDEGLQDRAAVVGGRLLAGLGALARRHAVIGDVRGLGLFVGVELVVDRTARTPAPDHAAHLVERMRDHGILLSTDGPDHNVIKIKPPMVFGEEDADRVVATMDRILEEDAFQLGG